MGATAAVHPTDPILQAYGLGKLDDVSSESEGALRGPTSQPLEGVLDMHESTTYQAILKQGRVFGEQQVLIRQGTKKLGTPDPASLAAIEAIRDPARLEAPSERMLDPKVRDWKSLLGGL